MKTLQIIILLLLTGLLVQAQQTLSLEEAIEKALENNYDIQIIKNEQKIAEITNNWGTAGRYPYISLSMGSDNSANKNQNDDYIMNRFSAGANINWTLFDGYSVRINKQRFEELEKLSKQNTAILVEGTIQSVILAYYAVLLENEKLKVYKEVMDLSGDRFSRAEHQKELGIAVTYDVLQAQNAFLSDKTNYLAQEVACKNMLRDLNYLMAEKNPVSYSLTEKFEAIPVEYTIEDLQSQMVLNNKGLQNQYINQRLLENAVASAKNAFSPTLGMSAGSNLSSTRYNYDQNGESWSKVANFYGNFTLSFNLFSGGNRKRALQIAQIDQETGTIKIDQMKHDLGNNLANLFEFYEVRKVLLNVANENLQAAKLNLQISKDKFEAGAINSFNYRDVQNIYLNAAQRKLAAIYDFIDTHTALLRMTGTIIQEYE